MTKIQTLHMKSPTNKDKLQQRNRLGKISKKYTWVGGVCVRGGGGCGGGGGKGR